MSTWRIDRPCVTRPSYPVRGIDRGPPGCGGWRGAENGVALNRSYGPWSSARIGGGGYVLGFAACPADPARLYAWIGTGGIFRSDDGGAGWRMIHGSLPAEPGVNEPRTVLADPRDPDVLVAAIGSEWHAPLGIFRSEDGGGSWRRTATIRFMGNGARRWDGAVLARHPQQPDVLLAAGVGDGIWRSVDGGRSWTAGGPEGLYPSDLRWDRRDPRQVWLAAHAETTGAGRFAGGWYRSADGGGTWSRRPGDAPDQVLQDPVDGSLLGIFGSVRVRRSRDGGDTWEEFSEGLPPPAEPGSNWLADGRLLALAAGPDFLLCATARGAVYRREYRAPGWTAVGPARAAAPGWWGIVSAGADGWRHFGSGCSALLVHPADPARWLMGDWFAVWRTADAGRTWTYAAEGMEGLVAHALAVDPADPRRVHLGVADSGYFRSEDGGVSFAPHHFPGGGSHVRALAVSPADPRRIWATGSRGYEWEASQPWRSDDGGTTWSRADGTGLPDMTERGALSIAAGRGGAGEAFLAVSGDVEPGGGGVYHTADGGGHWVWEGDGLPEGGAFFRRQIFDLRGAELAAGPDGGLVAVSKLGRSVWHRAAGAPRWSRSAFSCGALEAPLTVIADPGRPGRYWLAVDGGGVWRTDDGGATWTRVWHQGATTVAVDPRGSGRVAAGTAAGPGVSLDDGLTWALITDGLPTPNDVVLSFAGEGLLVGTWGNGVFRRIAPGEPDPRV